MPRPNQSTYRYLFENQDVKRWYDNLSRGSEITGDVYLRRLGAFCKKHDLSPADFAQMDLKRAEQLLMDHVTEAEKKYTGGYVNCTLKATKSWLAFNDRHITRKIRIRHADDAQSRQVLEERVPTKEELRKMLLSATKQSRVAIALMAFSGVRPETLGNYRGTDDLRIADLPELQIEKGKVDFRRIPAVVLVRADLSKTRQPYFTFLAEEGCRYVADFFEERLRKGEALSQHSPLVPPTKSTEKSFLRTTVIGRRIRVAMRRAGYGSRPYALRCYFDSELLLAESKGVITRDFRI